MNLPDGLSETFTRDSATQVTITLSGTATSHADANDVDDLTFTFNDNAFVNEDASTVQGSTSGAFSIDFANAMAIIYSGSFTESAKNDGSVTGMVTATLTGDTFTSAATPTTTNIPAGLTAEFSRTNTTVTMTLTGNANAHEAANNVSNLGISFGDGAFTGNDASAVDNSSKSDIAITFKDASSIAYSGSFTEAAANDGSVTGSVTATLTGDTFTSGADPTVTGIPTGLSKMVARTDTTVTLTLNGMATSHLNADDVSDLTISFDDDDFVNEDASTVQGSTSGNIAIDFRDPPNISYSGSFTEAAANDGSVTGSVTATLTGDTFTSGAKGSASNVPDGLMAVLTQTSSTTVTLTLSGMATSHASTDSIDDLTISFANSDFTGGNASAILRSSKSDIAIDFIDPPSITWSGNLAEPVANDGSVEGTITATLTGDEFTSLTNPAFENIPSGLGQRVRRTSTTTIEISFAAHAAAHAAADSITNLKISFSNADFKHGDGARVANAAMDFSIDFRDPYVVTYSGSFTEAPANDGSVTGEVTMTLTGDTFTSDVLSNVSASNVPDGLSADFSSASNTEVTMTLSGNATAHANANDVSNLTISFASDAFVLGTASTVDGASKSDIGIDFRDTSVIAYSGSFTEPAANDGTVEGSVIATITGGTFAPASSGTTPAGVDADNVPTGMTAVFTRDSDTAITMTLSGSATNNAASDSVTDLTIEFSDSAFVNEPASAVVNSSKDDIAVTFRNPSEITYSGSFTEAAANDGSVTGSVTATIRGDTFASGAGAHVEVTNFPDSLSAEITQFNNRQMTLTLTGNALDHAVADNVDDLTITFATGAFENEAASRVIGSSKDNLEITFRDPSSIAYSGSFTESPDNGGAVTGSVTITITGDTFAPASSGTTPAGVSASNVPAGLTEVFTRDSDSVITLSLIGNASAHADANDVSDLTITFGVGAFANEVTSLVQGTSKDDITIDFRDPSEVTFSGGFTETLANDGSVTGSITMTITGDTFAAANPGPGNPARAVSASVPAGLTAVFTRDSDRVITMTLTGKATNHADENDVGVDISFIDNSFANEPVSRIILNAPSPLEIDFRDPSRITYSGSFIEAPANDGSVTGSVTASLTGDIYAPANPGTPARAVAPSGVPPGLTAVIRRTSDTVVTLTLTGQATNHADANDVSNLGLIFHDASFENEAASRVIGSSTSDLTIDFTDTATITYSGSFTEAPANDGSVTGSVTATLSAATFSTDVMDHVTASSVPAGLSAEFTRDSSTAVTLTLTGNAAAHANANDVNIGISFSDDAFVNEAASRVSGSSNSNIGIDFRDPSSIAYSGSFTEALANDGSVTGSVTATLTGTTFATSIAAGVSASNVPAGLTAEFTRDNDSAVTMTLIGNATDHTNANDVTDLTITFGAAFANEAADVVINSSKSDIGIDFKDPSVVAYSGSFSEDSDNDGSVTGSVTATLTGTTFAASIAGSVSASGVPSGLTAVFTRDSDSLVTMTLTGSANSHADADDTSIGITFSDTAFVNEAADVVTGSSNSNIPIDFDDPSSIAYSGSFTEAAANDGSVTGSVTATLTGDTFAPASSGNTAAGVSASNVPAGLTAVFTRTSATVVTMTLSGNATNHANANDVTDLTITFSNAAFENEVISSVTGSSNNAIAIDFTDSSGIAYFGSFTEAEANDGSVTGSVTATLTGTTFAEGAGTGGTIAVGVSASNVPTGLTPVFTRTSDTVVTLTLNGNAANHANADDVNNLTITFADASFTNETAASVAGSSKSDIAIDFTDASGIAYLGGFTEAPANDGSVIGSVTATLTGDTFAPASTGTTATGVSATNVPAGLTPVFTRTSDTVVTLTLTGNATAHADADDVSDLTIAFTDASFTNETAASVAGSSKSDIAIDFTDNVTPDTTAPLLRTAAVNGATVTLNYDESLDMAHEPGTDAFTVVADGTTIVVSDIAIGDAVVTLTLQSSVTEGQTVTLNYAPPMAASERLQDAAGNETAMLTDQEVTNNTPPVEPPPVDRTIKPVPGETQRDIDGVTVTVVQAANALPGISLILPEDVSGNLPSGNELQVQINPPDPDAPEAERGEFSFGSMNARTMVDISLSPPLTAPIRVCLPVSQMLRAEAEGKPILIYRYDGNQWQPLPDSMDLGSEVCADVDEFSLFALGFSTPSEPTAPLAPSNLTAMAGGHDVIALSWTAPAEDSGRSTVTGYRVEWSSDGESSWMAFEPSLDADTTAYRDSGLTPGTTRHYRVFALSATGDSPASNTASATTEESAEPLAPSNLTAAAGHDAIALSWTAPTEDPGRSPVTGYRVEWSPDGGGSSWIAFEPALDADTTAYTDSGLTPGSTRHYRVFALSVAGDSPASDTASATTEPLTVAWAESDITVTEGGTAIAAVRLSAPANSALRIPLTVTPQHGALEGVPAAVMFAPGESQAQFTITAPKDDDAEDAEAILGFDALPEGISASQPTQARVTIVDNDKAAVARFGKLNEALLGRQALLLMDDVHFAVSSRLEALATGQIHSGQQGSPSTLATSFGHGQPRGAFASAVPQGFPSQPRAALASAGPQGFSSGLSGGAPSAHGGHFPGNAFSLGGQQDLAGLFAANAQALGEDRFNAAQLLGNSSFVLPLTAKADGEDKSKQSGLGGLTIWGSGNYHSLSNSAAGPSWNGEVLDALLGVDLALSPNLLAGLSLSGSVGSFDYTDPSDNASGQYESTLTGAHPYLGYAKGPIRLWGTAGFGEGEIEIAETGRSLQRSDTQLQAIAVGGRAELTAKKDNGIHTAWNLKSEATAAEIEVEGGGLIPADTVSGSRLRMALERRRSQTMSDGSMLTSIMEFGARRDSGFDTGDEDDFGAELGLGVEWTRGKLTLAARARSLIGGNGKEWGANVLIRFAGSADGKGLSLSAQPSLGDTASGIERLWSQGVSDFTAAGPGHADPRGLATEIGYGLMSSHGLVTPYGILESHRSSQSLRYGVRWNLLSNWDLSLENARRADDNGIFLRADWGFGSTGRTGENTQPR